MSFFAFNVGYSGISETVLYDAPIIVSIGHRGSSLDASGILQEMGEQVCSERQLTIVQVVAPVHPQAIQKDR
jgi:hypothetical protein